LEWNRDVYFNSIDRKNDTKALVSTIPRLDHSSPDVKQLCKYFSSDVSNTHSQVKYMFTDGACRNNQNRSIAVASYGYIGVDKHDNVDKIVGGPLSQTENHTNIRGEGWAIIKCYEDLVKNYLEKDNASYIICSDSQHWVNVCEYKIDAKANMDQVVLARKLHKTYSNRITLRFIKGYHKKHYMKVHTVEECLAKLRVLPPGTDEAYFYGNLGAELACSRF
jgi:ribonuclease HI